MNKNISVTVESHQAHQSCLSFLLLSDHQVTPHRKFRSAMSLGMKSCQTFIGHFRLRRRSMRSFVRFSSRSRSPRGLLRVLPSFLPSFPLSILPSCLFLSYPRSYPEIWQRPIRNFDIKDASSSPNRLASWKFASTRKD